MVSRPSIRGTVFLQIVEEVERLLTVGAVSREGLANWLLPEDEQALRERPIASAWYPIESCTRMNALLRDVAGNGQNEYLRELGRKSARQLLEKGHYRWIEYARRTAVEAAQEPEERFQAFGLDLRLFVSMSASLLNFSRWISSLDPPHARRYRIEVTEARALPDVFCWRADGFVNEIAGVHGSPDLWSWERPSAEVILFRMNRPV